MKISSIFLRVFTFGRMDWQTYDEAYRSILHLLIASAPKICYLTEDCSPYRNYRYLFREASEILEYTLWTKSRDLFMLRHIVRIVARMRRLYKTGITSTKRTAKRTRLPRCYLGTDHKENAIRFHCCVFIRCHSNGCQHMPYCLQHARHIIMIIMFLGLTG
jgi:hypothetical protein